MPDEVMMTAMHKMREVQMNGNSYIEHIRFAYTVVYHQRKEGELMLYFICLNFQLMLYGLAKESKQTSGTNWTEKLLE